MQAETLAVAFGACSAGGIAMAILGRTDPAVRVLIASMGQPGSKPRGRAAVALRRLGGTRWATGRHDAVLRQRLELAGGRWPIETVQGMKVALAGAAVFATLVFALVSPIAALLPLACAPPMYRIPDIAVARMAKRRQDRIALQVPDLAELLVATTRAGLTPALAFRRSAEALRGPLGDELAVALDQIALGVPWRTAIQGLSDRLPDSSLRRLIGGLARTQRLGTSVLVALRTVADDLRAERKARAEEAARRAPVKMLFPLVFLILPAFLLLTVGPVVVATVRSLH